MASLKDLIVNGIGRFVGKVYSAGGFVGNLEGTATKATQDGSGNTITSTYQAKVAKLGSTSKPVYTSAAGTFAECSSYAGGTAVTLNGTGKGATTASFYAPTAAGTAGQILKSEGTNKSPTWNSIASLVYPIGAIYISVSNTSPQTLFGGTWEALGAGRVLQTISTGQTAGSNIEAGLPNAKGWFAAANTVQEATNAFSWAGVYQDHSASRGSGAGFGGGSYNFDLASGEIKKDGTYKNDVYGKSDTVQPPAIAVYMWKRTA